MLVNAAGIALRYFELDTYFIFLGFRFHLSAVLPFIILFRKKNLSTLFEEYRNPFFKKKFIPFLLLIISIAVLFAVLFLLNEIGPADPDYFYEFGLSSIFDFPLYLLWNFPQLSLFYLTLLIFSRVNRFHYFNSFIGCVLLFAYEMIPFNSELSYNEIISFVLVSLIASLFITKLKSIYWFTVMIFSSVWSVILLFGSKSAAVINIFFAREYDTWVGYFKGSGEINTYIILFFFLIIFIIIFMYVAIFKKNSVDKKVNLS